MQHDPIDTNGSELVDWDDEPSGAVKWLVRGWLATMFIGATLIGADVAGLL